MKNILVITLALMGSVSAFSAKIEMSNLRGLLQYENPCIIAENPNGCLRVQAPEGGLFYLQREDHAPSAEFNILDFPQVVGLKLYQVFFTNLNSVLLANNQPVLVQGKIELHGNQVGAGGTILRADKIEAAAYLDN